MTIPDRPGIMRPFNTGQTNASTGGANKTPISATSVPYTKATAYAIKPGASANDNPGDNTGTVYISAADGNQQYSFPLSPGAAWPLPDNGDLSYYDLSVDTANDGVIVFYSV